MKTDAASPSELEQLRLSLAGLRELAAKQPSDINTKEDFTALRGVVSGCQRLRVGAELSAELSAELLGLLARPALPLEAHMLAGTALCLCLPLADLPPLLLDSPDPRTRLCLCHGLASAPAALLLAASTELREEIILRAVPRTLLTECVRLSRITPLAFRVLAGWLQRVRELELRLPASTAEELVVLVSGSWEVPLSGVRESCSRALGELFDLAGAGLLSDLGLGPARWLPRPEELLHAVLEHHPWTTKSKYFLLCVLLPRVPWAGGRGVPQGLLLGAASSHLVSAASDVYATILRTASLDTWRLAFLEPIADTLASSTNRLLVQNVLNHWIQPTVKALPESLSDILYAVRSRTENRDPLATTSRLALTFLLKLARREGLWDVNSDSWQWQAVLGALHHADPGVRGYAFAAVCDAGRAYHPLSDDEAAAVRSYMEHNVSVDSAALRQSLLGSLSWLLTRARNSGDPGTSRFLAWLHGFLLGCLEPGSNYQRKITALSAYLLVVRIFQEWEGARGPRARKAVRRSKLSNAVREHYHFGSERSLRVLLLCVADPTDDIRETAADILMECDAFRPDAELLVELTSRALTLCRSQLFYETESGALLARVVSIWAGGHCDELSEDALLREGELQLEALRQDVLSAASSGSPLHGVLAALRRAPKVCDPEILSRSARLLALLEGATEHCLSLLSSTSSSEFAPSFAEMGEAIDNLVTSALNKEDVLTLTPAHQLVLNCIWLNLKTCCSVASELAARLAGQTPCSDREAIALVRRCALILVAVLTRCRHKGAIEGAGMALQQVVRALTQPPVRSELSALPLDMLQDFLRLLLEGRTASGTSVSRRSAGLGIMVHRIVVGDQQPHKPLLQECVAQLLAVLSPREDSSPAPASEQHDTAEAQALHFLKMLVADAGLRVHMVPHLSHIALLCFQHLTSPVWGIRNAGLQLFGAIVPKLVGQRKILDEQEALNAGDMGAPVDELALRYPELISMLLSRLEVAVERRERASCGNILQEHAHLIPLLSLLARVSAPSFLLTSTELCDILARFKVAFLPLFDSPIAVVRSLAAKAYARFTPVSESVAAVRELSKIIQQRGENAQVGCLVAMGFLQSGMLIDGQCLPSREKRVHQLKSILKELNDIFDWENIPSVKHALFLNLNGISKPFNGKRLLGKIEEVLTELSSRNIMGIDQWISACIKQIMTNCPHNDIPDILAACLGPPFTTDVSRCIVQVLVDKLDKSNFSPEVLQSITHVCVTTLSKKMPWMNEEKQILKLLMKIVNSIYDEKVGYSFSSKTISNFLENFLVLGFPNISMVVKLVEKYSCPYKYDEDIRLSAAQTVKFLGSLVKQHIPSKDSPNFTTFMKDTGERFLLTVLQLLQDEESDIREEVAKFVKANLVPVESEEINPNSCIHHMLNPQFLNVFLLCRPSVFLFLFKILSESKEVLEELHDSEFSNPFDHGSQNVYTETIKTIRIAWEYCVLSLNDIGMDIKPSIWEAVRNTLNDVTSNVNLLEMKCTSKRLNLGEHLTPKLYFSMKKNYFLLQLFLRLCDDSDSFQLIKQLLDKVECFKQYLIMFL